MSRYAHPVAGRALLHTPEMRLRHPAERSQTVTENTYDEGAGCGFDNGSADGYAERWVDVDAGAGDVLAWFLAEFGALGWTLVEPCQTAAWPACACTGTRMSVLAFFFKAQAAIGRATRIAP